MAQTSMSGPLKWRRMRSAPAMSALR